MKETPIFEEVFERLIKMPRFGMNLFVGGLLTFIPVVNFFAFGYLYRVAVSVRKLGQPVSLEWRDWSGLFTDGIQFAVVWFFYWLIPVILVSLIGGVLSFVGLAALANVLLWAALFGVTLVFSSALYCYTMRKDFRSLLDVMLILKLARAELPRMIVPGLVFLGVIILCLPFYGFALFGGFLMLLTFSSLRYRSLEEARPAKK